MIKDNTIGTVTHSKTRKVYDAARMLGLPMPTYSKACEIGALMGEAKLDRLVKKIAEKKFRDALYQAHVVKDSESSKTKLTDSVEKDSVKV